MEIEQEDYLRGGTQKASYTEEETTQWPCPLCGSSDTRFIKEERGALKVVECSHCRLMRTNPRLHRPEEIYQGDSAAYEEEFRLVVSGKRPHHRDANYLRDLRLLEKYCPRGNFLDVGTNAGSFLRLARGRAWKLTGIEPSHALATFARRWWGLDIMEGFVETLDLPSNHFDIVTLTDVFEHVVNPRDVLSAIHQTIKPTGILLVKVPNGKFSVLKFHARRLLGKRYGNDFDSYEHVVHYTAGSLRAMLSACGFEPIEVFIDPPVQVPVWHEYVGRYYQHKSPFVLGWKTHLGRSCCYQLSLMERLVTRRIGWLAPNIGCLARPVAH